MTKVLVVDDSEQNRYLFQALLAGRGYEVLLAADGAEALAVAKDNPPDMIVSDILMPGMDGYALCRQWKRDEKLKDLPFVFYTATYTDPKDEQLALNMGADRFILKPQEPEALLAALEEVFQERKAGRPAPTRGPVLEETVYFKQYNEALIRKLEDKLVELESAKARLECEVAERKRAEEALALHGRRVQALLDLHLLSYAEESQVLDYVLSACLRMTQSEYSFIGTMDETESVMTICRWSERVTVECALPSRPVEYPIRTAGLWGECVRQRKPVIYNDYHAPHSCKKGLPEGHVAIDRFAAVPVLDGSRIVAVAAVANKAQEYTNEDTDALSTLLHKMWEILLRQRREREREVLEEQYRQAQKMEAVGQLAGGIAHDFNNILQAMVGYSSLLLDRLPEQDETHEFAEEIAHGAQRAAALTRQLLAFSRRQILVMEDLDLNDVIHGLAKMIQRIIGEDIEVRFVEGHGLGNVHADRGQMEQVLLNLCVNARDAMPEGGALTIETEDVTINSEYCDVHTWATPGQYVLLSVTDTGCGMDTEIQAHIFEPFFTTKEVGKGTGLGLATVYGIVRQHQGMVQVYSEVGTGTTFKVYLPSVERFAKTTRSTVAEPARGGDETVLVAEDDEALRKLAARILEEAGYTVLLATNGQEALDIFEQHASGIGLLLLDVVMPRMGGKAVYDVLRDRHPHLRFLFSSGYSTNAINGDFVPKEGVELIQKPYAPDVLLRKVREVLDKT